MVGICSTSRSEDSSACSNRLGSSTSCRKSSAMGCRRTWTLSSTDCGRAARLNSQWNQLHLSSQWYSRGADHYHLCLEWMQWNGRCTGSFPRQWNPLRGCSIKDTPDVLLKQHRWKPSFFPLPIICRSEKYNVKSTELTHSSKRCRPSN